MKINYKVMFLAVIYLSFISNSNANELDNAAACSGVVLGNAAVDYSLGDEDSFKVGVELAITAYLGEIFANPIKSEDVAIADQILASNTDKIINAANTETFDATVYEEVVQCYRKVASLLLKNWKAIEDNSSKINAVIDQRMKLLKRILSAG